MALEHAILVSLSEQSGAGSDLTRRFDRSIGFFWTATHQQIYRVLARMEADGWVRSEQVAQQGRPDKKVYDVTPAGRRELERWLGEPLSREQYRSELAVKLRAASYGDRGPLLEELAALRAEHATRLALFEELEARDYPSPTGLEGAELDQYLVLRGGIRMEQFWVDWLGEYLSAHGGLDSARRAGSANTKESTS
jgi:DNA-binding PadR family transcriptional regulator